MSGPLTWCFLVLCKFPLVLICLFLAHLVDWSAFFAVVLRFFFFFPFFLPLSSLLSNTRLVLCSGVCTTARESRCRWTWGSANTCAHSRAHSLAHGLAYPCSYPCPYHGARTYTLSTAFCLIFFTVSLPSFASFFQPPPSGLVPASQCPVVSSPNPAWTVVEWTFNLPFIAVNCGQLALNVENLWGNNQQTIEYISFTQGSVIIRTAINDLVSAPNAATRVNDIAAAIGTTSTIGTLATSSGLTSIRATTNGAPVAGPSGGGVSIGIIIGAVLGGLVLVAAIVILAIVLTRRSKRGDSDRHLATPLLTTGQQDNIRQHDIGSPYNMEHRAGETPGGPALVSLDSAKRKHDERATRSASSIVTPTASAPVAAAAARDSFVEDPLCYRVKLKYDLDSVNQDTVNGKAGDSGTVLRTDWDTIDGEWVWVKLNGKEGWAPVAYCERLLPSQSRHGSLRGDVK